MAPSPVLLALPARIRARGVTVVEMPGWQTRDSGDGPFAPIGILDHHDAMGLHTDAVPRNMTKPQTDGAQLWIHSNGSLYMLAAGRCWHAGSGSGYGDILGGSGNTLSVGIETDYSGTGPWPPALLATWRIVHHELAKLIGFSAPQVARRLAGHKEYAPARKVDPGNLDMGVMRANLVADLSGAPTAVSTRAAAPTAAPKPTDWFDTMDEKTLRDILHQEVTWPLGPKHYYGTEPDGRVFRTADFIAKDYIETEAGFNDALYVFAQSGGQSLVWDGSKWVLLKAFAQLVSAKVPAGVLGDSVVPGK